MLEFDRQQMVLHHLRINGSGNVAELAQALGVSPSTVRRDLADLSGRRLLTRVRGGASLAGVQTEPDRSRRVIAQEHEKRRIGAAAAHRIVDGSTLLISGGTTTEAMVPFLAGKERLTVLTNALNVANLLSSYREITVVVLGGILRHEEMSLLGPIAERTLAEFHVDVAFYSAFGIDADRGLYGAHALEASTDRSLLACAASVIVLADHTKFEQRGPVRLAPPRAIDCVITDSAADPEVLAGLRSQGVEVVTC
ncbi:DeoR/GlpR family transcriptional regulator of sugar metabolism [Nakamurella sp. UYEF19]|uniref:DeoR/GlpR family DNA-binding transcription regulator n=1 Tax=Nakamurella sp. UYEF19 TaxID=1756392 RepID=UPI0033918269